ncbi:MAG TPA: transporter [Sphingomicrobium sp.]|nr:transporter [Sphingomicrobium sp.]
MKLRLAAALALGAAAPAFAGPPYLTDDPIPTDTGHWEIYVFTDGEGRSSALDADAGVDLNYGPVKDVQLTATLPLSLSHEAGQGWRAGTGDVELAAKYRFFNDEKEGVSLAVFPRAFLPTSTLASHERTRLLLPLWAQKDFAEGTSAFGGGGYELNPGPRNRNFWQAGLAVTQDLTKSVSVGGEVAWQQRDSDDGTAETSAGLGTIVKLSHHYALLFSGGPTWADRRAGYHFYGSLGLFF